MTGTGRFLAVSSFPTYTWAIGAAAAQESFKLMVVGSIPTWLTKYRPDGDSVHWTGEERHYGWVPERLIGHPC